MKKNLAQSSILSITLIPLAIDVIFFKSHHEDFSYRFIETSHSPINLFMFNEEVSNGERATTANEIREVVSIEDFIPPQTRRDPSSQVAPEQAYLLLEVVEDTENLEEMDLTSIIYDFDFGAIDFDYFDSTPREDNNEQEEYHQIFTEPNLISNFWHLLGLYSDPEEE